MKRPTRQEVHRQWTEMNQEGGGVLALRVHSAVNPMELLRPLLAGDENALREAMAVNDLLNQFKAGVNPACWLCGQDVDFPLGIVLVSGHCDDPTAAIGGFICSKCFDPQADMGDLAAEALRKQGYIDRKINVHWNKGRA